MATSVEDGSLQQFRDEAQAIRDRSDWQFFSLLSTASLTVTSVLTVVILVSQGDPLFLWPILLGLVLSLASVLWTRREGRVEAGIALQATMMVIGICGVVLVQRGSHAPALTYGMATVAAVFIAGRARLGRLLGIGLLVWTGVVTWAAHSGRLRIDAANPLGLDNARLLAFAVAVVVIATAAHIVQRRRQGLDAILEKALVLKESERDEARALAERRARMLAEIGHEIRTPMTGIVGATQLLSQQAQSPVQRQLLSIQRHSAERLLHLVNAVLDQAKADAGPLAAKQEAYSVASIVADTTELFAPRAHRKDVEIAWTAEPTLPRRLMGDAMRLRQILCNLVSNAVKFTDSGSVQVIIRQTDSERIRFEVWDTGRGIEPSRQETIFERFVSEAPGDEQALSTGLGLPICRELAMSMGGQVSLISNPGRGSCFVLDLPCVIAPMDEVEAIARNVQTMGRLWIIGASAPLQAQLRYMLGEMGVDARFVDRAPSVAEWAEAAGESGERAPAQALLVDLWEGHGRCAHLFPALLEESRRNGHRIIVINSVAQDATFGALDEVWQIFRPASWDALGEALAWGFGAISEAAPEQQSAVAQKRVLLVDDNAINQIIGKAMLEMLGAEVVIAATGHAALEEAQRQHFDVVLMDLEMPGMDGLEATARLRHLQAERGLPRTPVVAVTGHSEPEVASTCRAAGIDELLVKPYTPRQLRVALRMSVHDGQDSDAARNGSRESPTR